MTEQLSAQQSVADTLTATREFVEDIKLLKLRLDELIMVYDFKLMEIRRRTQLEIAS